MKPALCSDDLPIQGRSQPNTARGAKKISGGPNIYHLFLKFEVKNRRKSAEEAKT